jgi:hypothetical protein
LSGIRNHDPSNQPAKTHASDRMATVTGKRALYTLKEDIFFTTLSDFIKGLKVGQPD